MQKTHTSNLPEGRINDEESVLPITGVVGIVFVASAGILAVVLVFRLRNETFVIVESDNTKPKKNVLDTRTMKIEQRNINRILKLKKSGKLNAKKGRKKKLLN